MFYRVCVSLATHTTPNHPPSIMYSTLIQNIRKTDMLTRITNMFNMTHTPRVRLYVCSTCYIENIMRTLHTHNIQINN